MSYRVINGKLYDAKDFSDYSYKNVQGNKVKDNKEITDFKQVLDKQIKKEECFTISSHAAQRLNSRNIDFDDADMKKINQGINMAEDKGAKQALILYKDMALITSIKNRTVITALDKNQSETSIITNIDSVVMI
ncbi:flagellar biosynthesis protein [Clostridium tagluense]|uniref:TIGR02530 family flagellar biosynthesis protein n=1 Tax=Clostridium tagluense TaxID=360422 RepID=UPI001C0E3E87|nr:TIGR02530 family flagellar biosynthesis protein [Clostridium tagluense]MBU3126641.1 flagellar biosynthesis protein [Clostridium tagluense]MBW9154944.1 flagellar biosynthesis protein [Clostridium tagluense]MCB2310009.1 flagellar biosynthesis protein [Clostridium tagluense]MCB2314461.1 flagellar biosynthesis protein [Clostridium tagluense]MCB2319309.1 flagellar biosynthesis protein [Clostridium tagluense]